MTLRMPSSPHIGGVVVEAGALSRRRGPWGGGLHTFEAGTWEPWTAGRAWNARMNTRYRLMEEAEGGHV